MCVAQASLKGHDDVRSPRRRVSVQRGPGVRRWQVHVLVAPEGGRLLERVLPGAQPIRLEASHPIFDSFYRIESLEFTHPNFGLRSQFFGIFEDNDPSKRLMMIINYNNDIGDYWEWSDAGYLPIDLSNQAYKLGVNYIMYAMTR